jgi:glycogen synthase
MNDARHERTVVFCTFESEFARYGGLGAVMSMLPKEMIKQERCIVVAPHFRRITDLASLKERGRIDDFEVMLAFCMAIAGRPYRVEVTQVTQSIAVDGRARDLQTYLIGVDGLFTAAHSPYVNPCNADAPLDPYHNPVNSSRLTEDALFFSACVPKVLVELSKAGRVSQHLLLHLQDWQTASVPLALQRTSIFPAIHSAKCVLTVHNPYDRYVHPHHSQLVGELMAHLNLSAGNLLVQTLEQVSSPVSTVSENFARELVSHPLHAEVYARHLQDVLQEKNVVGINNGIFLPLDFPQKAVRAARRGRLKPIVEEKRRRRQQLIEVLQRYRPEEAWGELEWDDFDGPIFLMFGRDDPRQKGYDVVVEAIRSVGRGRARYVFTPIPGDEGLVGLQFLKQLAQERAGEVKAFPFRMQEGYGELQRGSTFMVMASLYEPFGAAIEGYAVGTPVVARATGGLVQQVQPYPNEGATGFLFQEKAGTPADWQHIVDCAYWSLDPKGDRVEDRRGIPLFGEMVEAAASALRNAIAFYTAKDGETEHARMIANGFGMLQRFTWAEAVARYRSQLYGPPQ